MLGKGFLGKSLQDYIGAYHANDSLFLSSRDISLIDFQDFDLIVHSAASADPKKSNQNPIKYFEESVATTKLVYDKILNENPEAKYIYISSGCVNYSKGTEITKSYLESKRVGELYTHDLLQKGVKANIVRLFSVVGPHIDLSSSLAINSFIRNGREGRDLTVHPSANKIERSYLYADEMCKQILSAPYAEDFLVEVGSPDMITILSVAEIIQKYYQVNIRILDTQFFSNTVDKQLPLKPRFSELSSEQAILKTLKELNND